MYYYALVKHFIPNGHYFAHWCGKRAVSKQCANEDFAFMYEAFFFMKTKLYGGEAAKLAHL